MRTRQPADQRMDPYVPRTGGTLARSPSERLEPTRPPTRPRRLRGDREPRRSSPFVRFLNGLLTFVLLLMLVVGAIAYVFDAQVDAPGPLEKGKTVVIPKGEGTHEGTLVSPAGEIPATHKRLNGRCVQIFKVEGDVTTETHLYYDQVQVMTQLGLMPELATA